MLLDIDRGGDIIDLARKRYVSATIFIFTATAAHTLRTNNTGGAPQHYQ
jgi:hypothetical protein